MDYGFYSGDHHIHAAGCAHYTNPTEGVFAEDMFLHVKGEGTERRLQPDLGPVLRFPAAILRADAHKLSEPFTVLKYDVEVSGFGSQALGHVCLLNLRDQTYPGSEGTKTKGWPTWTTPLMHWAKEQGAVTGYAHSANGLGIERRRQAPRSGCIAELDTNKDGKLLGRRRPRRALLPEDVRRRSTPNSDGFMTADGAVARHAARRNEPAAEPHRAPK